MGHISFPWSYIFWRSTSLGLPCKSNPTPTTKIKIATFTTSILAEGTEHVVPVEKISSKKPEKKTFQTPSVLCCPFYQTQYHWFIAWIHRGCSQKSFSRFDVKVIFHPQEYLQPPCELFIIFHLPPPKNLFMRVSQPVSQTCSSSPIFRNENAKTLWNLKIISLKKACKSANHNLKKILKSYDPDYNL